MFCSQIMVQIYKVYIFNKAFPYLFPSRDRGFLSSNNAYDASKLLFKVCDIGLRWRNDLGYVGLLMCTVIWLSVFDNFPLTKKTKSKLLKKLLSTGFEQQTSRRDGDLEIQSSRPLQLKVPGPWYTCWIPTQSSTLHISPTTLWEPAKYIWWLSQPELL